MTGHAPAVAHGRGLEGTASYLFIVMSGVGLVMKSDIGVTFFRTGTGPERADEAVLAPALLDEPGLWADNGGAAGWGAAADVGLVPAVEVLAGAVGIDADDGVAAGLGLVCARRQPYVAPSFHRAAADVVDADLVDSDNHALVRFIQACASTDTVDSLARL